MRPSDTEPQPEADFLSRAYGYATGFAYPDEKPIAPADLIAYAESKPQRRRRTAADGSLQLVRDGYGSDELRS
jgi:hypothetical protein